MRGELPGSPWKGRSIILLLLFCTFSFHIVDMFNEFVIRMESAGYPFICFFSKIQSQQMSADCTGAYGLRVSPRRGAPKATQNYSIERPDSRLCVRSTTNLKTDGYDNEHVSKKVTLILRKHSLGASRRNFFSSHY